jgi:hypothetical protein
MPTVGIPQVFCIFFGVRLRRIKMCHTEPTNERAERLSSLRLSRARRRKAKPNHGKHRKVRLWRMLGSRTDFGRSARKTQRSPNIPKPVRASISVARRHSCVPHNPARGLHNGHPDVFAYRLLPSPLFTCEITCDLYTNYVRIIHEFSCGKTTKRLVIKMMQQKKAKLRAKSYTNYTRNYVRIYVRSSASPFLQNILSYSSSSAHSSHCFSTISIACSASSGG